MCKIGVHTHTRLKLILLGTFYFKIIHRAVQKYILGARPLILIWQHRTFIRNVGIILLLLLLYGP